MIRMARFRDSFGPQATLRWVIDADNIKTE